MLYILTAEEFMFRKSPKAVVKDKMQHHGSQALVTGVNSNL
jgi:hypothetical protein